EFLLDYMNFIYEYRDKYFGNARTVRGIVNDAIRNHNLRFAALSKSLRKKADSDLITIEDMKTFSKNKEDSIFSKKSIGFRRPS
ncbi:MAG: hypothetical protein ACI8VT_001689, partial [Saprospiraceae bacterium]